ncbi:MAG: class I SAM-dependent methyltransferase [Candidatus Hydrogenedentes bacterium]|nr:class I SAM-dependent methyltransferase [Candidatus Hydrogenedentota bacterium]
MADRTEWADFFDGHAPVYNDNCFTKNTLAEVDFLVEELGLAPGASILDVGCGTGRHSVELARRGYAVTGVDLSAGMLEQARKAAAAAGVDVTFLQADATEFTTNDRFDAAICLCEGAFGLLASGGDPIAQPLAILRNVSNAMKPGAKCVFNALNACALIRRHTQENVASGVFDPMGLSEVSECAPDAESPAMALRERAFVATELVLLFGLAGLEVLCVWGGTAGDWGKRAIELDGIEIMLVGRKPADPGEIRFALPPRP